MCDDMLDYMTRQGAAPAEHVSGQRGRTPSGITTVNQQQYERTTNKMCVHMYIYIYIYVCVYIYIYIYIYTYMYI